MRRTRREDLDVPRAREVGEGADDVAAEAADVRVAMRAEATSVSTPNMFFHQPVLRVPPGQ